MSRVNIDAMARRPYHHGDLRAALIAAARAMIEARGHEELSLRDLAQSLGVSTAAPYRHFPDRRALLAEIATLGFAELATAYAEAQAEAADPQAAMRQTARAYLDLAFQRPGLFGLMFATDLVGADDAPPQLLAAARLAWERLVQGAAALEPAADAATLRRRVITGWSTLHGFATLSRGGRLDRFIAGPLSDAELFEAILEKTVRAT